MSSALRKVTKTSALLQAASRSSCVVSLKSKPVPKPSSQVLASPSQKQQGYSELAHDGKPKVWLNSLQSALMLIKAPWRERGRPASAARALSCLVQGWLSWRSVGQ
eukprot:1767607-Alexandrium_andersonii.AAC.1